MQDQLENAAVVKENVQTNLQDVIRLDYSIEDPEERVKLVEKIIENTPQSNLTNRYLEILANYIIFAMTKKQKKEKKINTENRMVTINKRQTSFEGLVGKFENGEDGIYNMIINDKNVLLTPKYQITKEDIEQIPALKQLRDEIAKIEEQQKKARGKKKFLLKKQIIEMRQDQYVIKSAYRPVTYSLNLVKSLSFLDLSDKIEVNQKGQIINKGLISLFNPTHISILLCNYSKIKESCWDKFNSDIYYLMIVLEQAIDTVLKKDHPMLYDLLIYKIDGKSNLQIQNLLFNTYNTTHSIEYLSSLWRNKIPKMIADYVEKQQLVWYYTTEEKGKWKRCSRCGQIKLAHNKFFSKNNTSKDGFYSICKECRNKKTKEEKTVKIKVIKRGKKKEDG